MPAPRQWDQHPPAGEAGALRPGLEERFQKESRFADPDSLLANLTVAERTLIFELVEQDVAREYEKREKELKTGLEEQLAAEKAAYESRLAVWADDFGQCLKNVIEEDLTEIGKSSARLAIRLAGKLTRSAVPLDEDILVRAIQTTLYKIEGSVPIRLAAHPEDALWLRGHPDLLRQWRIEEVNEDRRLERGGCLVGAGGREWDATLEGQLETLGEIIQEAIDTSGEPHLNPVPGEQDDTDRVE